MSYVPISNTVLSSNTNTVTLSSIPQNYASFFLRVKARSVSGKAFVILRFNGVSTTTYSTIFMTQYAPTNFFASTRPNKSSIEVSEAEEALSTTTAGFIEIEAVDYSNTSKRPQVMIRVGNNDNALSYTGFGENSNTQAITSMTFSTTSDNFAAGSEFQLYGIEG